MFLLLVSGFILIFYDNSLCRLHLFLVGGEMLFMVFTVAMSIVYFEKIIPSIGKSMKVESSLVII